MLPDFTLYLNYSLHAHRQHPGEGIYALLNLISP